MLDAASKIIEEDTVIENMGSHGDSPSMTDEGRRAEVINEHAARQSSKPKPISRAEKRVSWACHGEENQELHTLREMIDKDMIDETRKAIMQINANKPAV